MTGYWLLERIAFAWHTETLKSNVLRVKFFGLVHSRELMDWEVWLLVAHEPLIAMEVGRLRPSTSASHHNNHSGVKLGDSDRINDEYDFILLKKITLPDQMTICIGWPTWTFVKLCQEDRSTESVVSTIFY